ncbi:MAG: hypothetical protein PHI44_05630 [Candidatus Ratteibacteria bacterium]|nr:hypothetical protein [Candidatus Ratteibacteria bacterium]
MANYEIIYSIVNISIAFILITLSVIMLKINRKKFVVAIVFSVIFTGLSLYYLCLVSFLYPHSVLKEEVAAPENIPLDIGNQKDTSEKPDFIVIITTDNNTFSLVPEDELEIKKGTRFKIEKVVYPSGSPENIKADIKGFAGNARQNDQQDIGFWVTYSDMLKHWAVKGKQDTFEVEIKDGKDIIGKVYIKFID